MSVKLRLFLAIIVATCVTNVMGQVNPTVSINGGSRVIADTDGMPGEAVLLRATAADADGEISDIEWIKDGFAEGWGEELFFSLDDGPNTIRVVVTDNDGLQGEDSVTITISAPIAEEEPAPEVDEAPFVTIVTSDLIFEDTDARDNEQIEVIGYARDDNQLAGVYWQVDGGQPQALASTSKLEYESTFSARLSPGTYRITFWAQDRAGNSSFTEETITVIDVEESKAIKSPKFTINNASEIEDTNNVTGEFIELEISRDTASQQGATPTQFVLITSYPLTQNFSMAASTSEMLDKLQNIVRDAPEGEITLLSNYVSSDPGNNLTLPNIRLLDGDSTIYVTLIQTGGLGSTVSKTFNVTSPPDRPELSFGYVPSVVADTDEKIGETVNIEVIIESEEVVYLVVYDQFGNKLFESEDETALQVGNLNIPLELLSDGHNEILVTARNKAGGTDTISTGDLKIEVRASEYSELDFDNRQESSTLSGGTSEAAFYLLVTSTTGGKTSGISGKIAIEPDEGFEVIVRIEPEANHVGKEAELFVIGQYQDRFGSSYSYSLDEYGVWHGWSGTIADLRKFESLILEEKNTRTILKVNAGALSGPSTLSFFVAYGLNGQSELYYTGTPIRVDLK